MPLNVTRRSLIRERNFPLLQQIEERPRIAEVFEDLATESVVELVVYETFLDLNPQVREFPNLNPDEPVIRDEERISITTGRNTSEDIVADNSNQNRGNRRIGRRDLIRRYRLR